MGSGRGYILIRPILGSNSLHYSLRIVTALKITERTKMTTKREKQYQKSREGYSRDNYCQIYLYQTPF